MKYSLLIFIICFLQSCNNPAGQDNSSDSTSTAKTNKEFGSSTEPEITPISHATFVLEWNDLTIYNDPTGGREAFADHGDPDIILISDIHGDHMNKETLTSLNNTDAVFVMPQAVADEMVGKYTNAEILKNGDKREALGITIEAIPMYNLPETEDSRHPKGRGNGYVLTLEDKRIYISGDTEDIDEMRALENIDIAFVCMNLPYTMTVEQAAEGVLAFAPKIVYPYHYRGQDGLSNVEKFKELVQSKNENIEVRLLDWYPGQ